MKIAIQGHPTRGKEVIEILKSLGGINSYDYSGNNFDVYYELHRSSIVCVSTKSDNYKYYTLEEFEKEFPFKVGDKVIYSYTPNLIGTVVDIKFDDIISYRINIKGATFTCGTNMLKPYKEMKEERNITLTLDKAKEWYKKGGELKEIALQAFNEEELTKVELPKSWEEFCKNYPIRGGVFYIDTASDIQVISSCATDFRDVVADRNICPSKKSAEAHLAMMQLEQLRDCWRQGWKPSMHKSVYAIKFAVHGLNVYYFSSREFLSFPTKEMAEEFLKCFRDLIEQAGDLI